MIETIWTIELFGGLRARQRNGEIKRFHSAKMGALLAYLACHPRQEFSREHLSELLWPEADADSGRHSLRQLLTTLRGILEPDGIPEGSILITTRSHAQLNFLHVTTDVETFTRLADAAEAETDHVSQLPLLHQALELYQGSLLPDYYEDWIQIERDRMEMLYVRLTQSLLAALEQQGEANRALDLALRAMKLAPQREEIIYELMRLYDRADQPEAALKCYGQLERRLKREQGARPAERLSALAVQLGERLQSPRLRPPTLPREISSRSYEKKNRSRGVRSEPKTQESAEDAPLSAGSSLPRKVTRFFGRETEMEQLRALLGRSPLVTLTGVGGCGKTRLALETAQQISASYPRAIVFVPLESLTGPGQILGAIEKALGVRGGSDVSSLLKVVTRLLAKPTLLILDNFEHLTEGGADIVWSLIERVPELVCLVTSRQRLNLSGEYEMPLQPLPLPEGNLPPARLMEFACVQLFVDRAQAAVADFTVTPRNAQALAALCRRLEGIPLAIELSAARISVVTPIQMLTQLTDRFGFLTGRQRNIAQRHQTLRAAVDWSYDLLTPPQQKFFRRLSVFRGGWTLEAAEVVCAEPKALEFLQQLKERSLVFTEEVEDVIRFRLLETLREYGDSKLTSRERTETINRYIEYFVNWAETVAPHLREADGALWIQKLDLEQDNLRAVLESPMDNQARLQLCGALWRYWIYRSLQEEGRERLETALRLAPDAEPGLRARALLGAAMLAGERRDAEATDRYHDESLALMRQAGDRRGIAEVLNSMGITAGEQGKYDLARTCHEEALALRRELGLRWTIAGSLGNLGFLEMQMGHYAAASAYYGECAAIYREYGSRDRAAWNLLNQGVTAHFQGDYITAAACYEEALEFFRRINDRLRIAYCLQNLSDIAARTGSVQKAVSLANESIALYIDLDDFTNVFSPLEVLSIVARSEGNLKRAARLLGAIEHLREKAQAPQMAAVAETYRQEREALKEAMGPMAFEVAVRQGRAMPIQELIAYALQQE